MKNHLSQSAESRLFLMVKDNKKHLRYVSSTLSEISEIMNNVCKSNLDIKFRNMMLRLVYEDRLKNVGTSTCIDEVVRTHLLNACKARYMNTKVRK